MELRDINEGLNVIGLKHSPFIVTEKYNDKSSSVFKR